MKFELKEFDVTYSKDKLVATVCKDEHKVMIINFNEDTNIFNIVSDVALMMVFAELLTEEDIEDVMEVCGIPMENAREELRGMRESMQRAYMAS